MLWPLVHDVHRLVTRGCSGEVEAILLAIREVSRKLLARYPFDDERTMHRRWRNLALLQLEYDRLVRKGGDRDSLNSTTNVR